MSDFAVFFFFQAEDGIRDADVTGVQTCALPIWEFTAAAISLFRRAMISGGVFAGAARAFQERSEERRVGEEGRSRWSPYHLKKKRLQNCDRESCTEHSEHELYDTSLYQQLYSER